ncbi:MAG TPA: GNAT family N-acetyltransferase [Thermoleophilaceae bacterium]|nr:GNAT family N-acetyltransferase [Thermoleophilaceae bacterium]
MRRALPGGYELDDDRDRIDVDAVHAFIGDESYWAKGRSRETMQAAIDGSARVIGLYTPDGSQVGFARVISDSATYAYLADVFVLADHRGRGLGVELIREAVEGDPWSNISWHLRTSDAQTLYAKFGFGPPSERSLER